MRRNAYALRHTQGLTPSGTAHTSNTGASKTQQRQLRQLANELNAHLADAYCPKSKPTLTTALNAFARFAETHGNGAKFMQPRSQADLRAHTHNETIIMLFMLWLSKQKSKKGVGLLAQSTTETYADLVSRQVQHQLGCAITHRPARIKRLTKLMRNQTTATRRKRMGLRCAHLREIWEKHKEVKEDTRAARAMWAMVTVAWGLMARAGEMTQILLQDVSFHRLRSGTRYVMIMLAPLKKQHAEKIPQIIKYIPAEGEWQPYLALKRFVTASKRAHVSNEMNLFALPNKKGNNKVISVESFRQTVRQLAANLQLPANQFGAHSCRIGGATDLFADNQSDDIIVALQNRGRWASDVYKIYVRITRRSHLHTSQLMFAAGGRSLEELIPSFVQPAS